MAQQHPAPPLTKIAAPPFDGPDYDLVLRSADLVDFRLWKRQLQEASKDFTPLITKAIQKLSDEHAGNILPAGAVPVVAMEETSDTLYELFRTFYSVVTNLDGVTRQLETAEKYRISNWLAVQSAKQKLQGFAVSDPLRVFALACRFGFPEIPLLAAREARKQEVPLDMVFVEDMRRITAGALFRLRLFLRGLPFITLNIRFGKAGSATQTRFTVSPPTDQMTRFMLEVENALPCQLQLIRTADGQQLRYWRDDLCKASRVFDALCKKAGPSPIHLDEDYVDAIRLLALVYFHGHPDVEDLAGLKTYVKLAEKYEMYFSLIYLRRQCLKIAEVATAPLSVYFYAVIKKWYNEARWIARRIASDPHQILDTYVSEMELVSAEAYNALLVYNHQCKATANAVVEKRHSHALMRPTEGNTSLLESQDRDCIAISDSTFEELALLTREIEEAIAKAPLCLDNISDLPGLCNESSPIQFDYCEKDIKASAGHMVPKAPRRPVCPKPASTPTVKRTFNFPQTNLILNQVTNVFMPQGAGEEDRDVAKLFTEQPKMQ